AEAIALFIFHTYAWELRDITTYLGIESPRHRCGKSTVLGIIRRLVNRPEVAAHISSPAMFRAIHSGKPTLITDETDKVLRKNQLLCGILNASYSRELACVVRVVVRSRKPNANNPSIHQSNNPSVAYLPLDIVYGQTAAPPNSHVSADGEPPTGNGG